jgi:hypothetical protein
MAITVSRKNTKQDVLMPFASQDLFFTFVVTFGIGKQDSKRIKKVF